MKDYMTMLKFMWPYLKPYKKRIFFYAAVSFLNYGSALMNSMIVGKALDAMLANRTLGAIVSFAVLFLVMNIITVLCCYFARIECEWAMNYAWMECRERVAKHVERTSLKYLGTVGTISFMRRIHEDSCMLTYFFISSIAELVAKVLTFAISIFLIFRIDAVCGAATLLELPLIIFLYKSLQKKMPGRSREVAEKTEIDNRKMHELLADPFHIRKNGLQDILEKRYHEAAAESISASVKKERLSFFHGFLNGNMDMLLNIFLFFYGGISVIQGRMSVGEFYILYTYFWLVTTSCSYLLSMGQNIQGNKAYYERMKAMLDVKEESNGEKYLEAIEEISLSHVDFGYTEDGLVLKDFSYTFKRGKIYAIAGGNGCGKSTMTTLLLGMYVDDYAGTVTYNGCPIKELDMRKMRWEKIGVCEQEPYLIEDTIRYNMIYSNDKAEDAALMELAYQVSLDGFLKGAAKGLDTLVGEGGNALSGGQKQKTALVKAFYKNPQLLVLDEPTSAMDAEGQERFLAYLRKIKEDKIIVIVTHDSHMLEEADEVVRMGAA